MCGSAWFGLSQKEGQNEFRALRTEEQVSRRGSEMQGSTHRRFRSWGWSMCPTCGLGMTCILVSCRLYGVGTVPAAGVFVGTAVGAAVLNRAETGECWAVCSGGWRCDRDAGLCVRDERAGCAPGEECGRVPVRPKNGEGGDWDVDAGHMDAEGAADAARECEADTCAEADAS